MLDVLARRSSAVAKPQADAPPETVKLERGLGAKARFNGQSATLGAKSAGWTNAVVSGTPVKWRTGHWSTPLMPTTNCFLLLADTLLLKIMRLLDTPSVCNLLQADRTFSALRSEAPFAKCHLCMGVPNGFGVVPSKQLRFAAELGRARAPLTSMRVDVGRDELTVLRWVLQNCDTEKLATVRINAFEERKGQMLLSLAPSERTNRLLRAASLRLQRANTGLSQRPAIARPRHDLPCARDLLPSNHIPLSHPHGRRRPLSCHDEESSAPRGKLFRGG